MRFYEPTSGRITLDGVDIRDIDVDWLRSQVGLVGQEPILFHASVFDNVAYGKPHSTQVKNSWTQPKSSLEISLRC